ncbi:MAG: metallophosphoesterase [Candidatus Woesearchaeota archaeon]
MKILALSDLHGDRTAAKELAERGAKENVDLVVLAGDLVNHLGDPSGIVGPFKAKGLDVALMPGNHEGMAEINFLIEKYGAKNLHGYVIRKGDVGIFGCGYGDVGIHQLSDDDFFNTLKRAHDSIKDMKKKIMITHVQPSDSIIGLGMWPGSEGVRRAVEQFQPDLHICGHIHETEGIEDKIGRTRIINIGKKGRIFEF